MAITPVTGPLVLPGRAALQQHPYYAAALELLGGQAQSYLATEGGLPIALIQVVERKLGPAKLAWVPRGPTWEVGTTVAQKRNVVSELGQIFPSGAIRIMTPDDADTTALLRRMDYRKVVAGQQYAKLDLTPKKSVRLAQQHGKWRNRLRHAENSGIQVCSRPFSPSLDRLLLQLELLQRRKLKYKSLPPSFTLAWARANKNAAQLFMATDNQGCIAFVLILVHPPTATYHIGWSNERGRAASCHNLLLWCASNWLAERSTKEFDLGMIDPVRAPGLTRFKLGIGAVVHHTGPTMIALPRLRLPKIWSRAA